MIIFDQTDIMKNTLTNNNNENEFSSTISNIKNFDERRRKLRMIKCNKHTIKINDIEIFAIVDSKTKINLINNVFVKKFKLISFNVFTCEIMIVNNFRIKSYDVYFVRLKISNENDINRFFNESFLKVDLS